MRETYRLLESLSQGRKKRGEKIKCVRGKKFTSKRDARTLGNARAQHASALLLLFQSKEQEKRGCPWLRLTSKWYLPPYEQCRGWQSWPWQVLPINQAPMWLISLFKQENKEKKATYLHELVVGRDLLGFKKRDRYVWACANDQGNTRGDYNRNMGSLWWVTHVHKTYR